MIDKRFEFRERELFFFLCYRNISRVPAMTHVAAEKRRKEGGNSYICEMAEPCSPAEAVSQRKVKIGQSCVITPNPEAWRNQWLERITVNKARKRRN